MQKAIRIMNGLLCVACAVLAVVWGLHGNWPAALGWLTAAFANVSLFASRG